MLKQIIYGRFFLFFKIRQKFFQKEGDSLQLICEKFADPETENSMNLTGHLLCKPFRPMLLKRLNYNKYCLAKVFFKIIFIFFLLDMIFQI